MSAFRRYAIYYLPSAEAFAPFATAWLGWDAVDGQRVVHPNVSGLPAPVATLADRPRRYGLHATLKPPFRLAEGTDVEALLAAARAFAAETAAARADGLRLARLGRFLALVPVGDPGEIAALAGSIVRAFDPFRAPASAVELARRRASGLTPAQDALLLEWGYPYVFDEFRFHITLTGPLREADARAVEAALQPQFSGLLPTPFEIGDIALAGEDEEGFFHLIHRYGLTGARSA